MRTILAFLTLALASQCLFALVKASPITNAVDVKALCEGDKDFEITSASQISGFVAQLGKGADCPELIKTTLTDLEKIIEIGHKDICSHEAVDPMKEYLIKHAHDNHRLPKTLERFVISYFMKIAHECKASMVKQLSQEKIGELTEEDFSALEKWIKENGDIDQTLDDAADSDNILLPSDLLSILDHKPGFTKLEVHPDNRANVRQIQERCEKRFRPIYLPILMATVMLGRAGFNTPDMEIRQEIGLSEKEERRLDQFNRIVYLCETMELMNAEGEPAEKLEPIRYQAPTKVVVDEVEILDDGHIDDILTNWYHHVDEIRMYKDELYDSIVNSLTNNLTPGEAEEIRLMVPCILESNATERDDDDNNKMIKKSAGEEKKKKCGGLPAGTAITYIFFGSMIAGMMMLMSGD